MKDMHDPAGIKDTEARFDINEIFFSRTDDRGIIRSGNEVFQRISGHSWDKLLGAPHKIVRHPNMPKAVFSIMWDRLQKGQPICAYVKNKDVKGGHYWVFAVATPLEGGYLSVRIKPTSALHPVVKKIYAEVLHAEKTTGIDPATSAKLLVEKLKAEGFVSYETFMTRALFEEGKSRHEQLGTPPNPKLLRFGDLIVSIKSLVDSGVHILKAFDRIRETPMNLRVQASKLGDHSGPMGIIAANYSALATNIKSNISHMVDSSVELLTRVEEGQLLGCICELQKEVVEHFEGENDLPNAVSKENESGLLLGQSKAFEAKSSATNMSICDKVNRFATSSKKLKRTMSGLDLTRIFCQIEMARIGDPQGSMSEIMEHLQRFQRETAESLHHIDMEIKRLRAGAVM